MPDFAQFDDNIDSKAAEQFAFANAQTVSTLTHTTREVAEHFLEWRKNLKKTNELKSLLVDITTKKVNKKKSNGGLREAAFAMFAKGSTPKQVSVELNITYANAHYYKRAMAK